MSHYCKICGCYKSNESFSGRGHAQHVCKKCAHLPAEIREERLTLNRIYEQPWRLSKGQLQWLEKLKQHHREKIREAAEAEWNKRFVARQQTEDEGEEDDDWIPNPEYDWLAEEGTSPDRNWVPDPNGDYELPF
ncbi:MAG: hypothetical protein IKG87_14105 [Clostridia bacterium]|nr:hypothetical protein [Clostridia bacterium]